MLVEGENRGNQNPVRLNDEQKKESLGKEKRNAVAVRETAGRRGGGIRNERAVFFKRKTNSSRGPDGCSSLPH